MQPNNAVDTVRLGLFKKKREEWLFCLSGDDVHSIWKQQCALLWDYALFLTVQDLRIEAARNLSDGVGFNAPVLRLFDVGFVVTQLAGIRRLTEKQWKDPSRHVISLRALADDIRQSRDLMTREVYLGLRELPFDPAPARQRVYDRMAASGEKFFFECSDKRGPEEWYESERAHERFDKLSESTPASRTSHDLVSLKWFDMMNTKIESCEDVCALTDKFIAHAANPVSRAVLKEAEAKVSLSRLAECHQALLQVAGFIAGPLLQDSMTAGVPVPQFNLFENLDKAWVNTTGLAKARDYWKRHADEIEKWTDASLL